MITVECTLSPGRTGLVAELYELGTDTPISSTSFAYKTNDKCRVVFTWSTTPNPGRYRFTVREGTTSYGLENDMVTIEGDGPHYIEREEPNADNSSIEESLQDLIDIVGSGSAVTHVPVANNGNIEFIVIGDSYLDANGRAFSWLIDPVPGYTTLSPTTFGVVNVDDPTIGFLVNGTITVVDDKWQVSFDVDDTITALLTPGTYKWSVSVGAVTVIINYKECQTTEAIEKQS